MRVSTPITTISDQVLYVDAEDRTTIGKRPQLNRTKNVNNTDIFNSV